MKDSTTMLRSQCDALEALPPEQFKSAVVAIWRYELDGIEPDGDPVAMMALGMAKPIIEKRKIQSANASHRKPTSANRSQSQPTDSQPEPIDPIKIKDKSIKERSPKGDPKKSFSPPTPDQVREYAEEHGYKLDAQRFVDFYASKGWVVGRSPMKDWKAAVRNWGRTQRQELTANGTRQETTARPSRFNNFPQRQYDYDELEAQLLARR